MIFVICPVLRSGLLAFLVRLLELRWEGVDGKRRDHDHTGEEEKAQPPGAHPVRAGRGDLNIRRADGVEINVVCQKEAADEEAQSRADDGSAE